jgi:hypothetical protein
LPEDGARLMDTTQSPEAQSPEALPGIVARSLKLIREGHFSRSTLHYLNHSWKVRSLNRSLARALGESWEASSWPGDRLAVGVEMSEKVEKLTRLLNRETEVHGRLVALLK